MLGSAFADRRRPDSAGTSLTLPTMSPASGNSRADNSARRPVLFIQRRPVEGPGAFAEVLGECGLAWRCSRLHAGDVLPAGLDDWSLLVVLGDAIAATSPDQGCTEPSLIELVELAVRRDFPTIGIGSGAELLLAALGTASRSGSGPVVGWHDVQLTAAGRGDRALAHVPASFPGFHWHRHELTVSEGAVALAATDGLGCQAFRIGEKVYGFGFHPEVTGWMVGRWVDAYPAALGAQAELVPTLLRDTSENADGSRLRMRDLLRGLLPALGVVSPGMGPVVNRTVE